MNMLKDNILLVFAIAALIAAVIVIMTGHATDGAALLGVLYTVIGGATGGHLMAQTPGAAKTSASPEA